MISRTINYLSKKNLRSFDSFYLGNSSDLDILYPIGHLNAVLKLATEDSIPNFKPEVRLKLQRYRPWLEKIHEAVKYCRLTWWEWKKADASGNPTDPDFIKMRKANKNIKKSKGERQQGGKTYKLSQLWLRKLSQLWLRKMIQRPFLG